MVSDEFGVTIDKQRVKYAIKRHVEYHEALAKAAPAPSTDWRKLLGIGEPKKSSSATRKMAWTEEYFHDLRPYTVIKEYAMRPGSLEREK